VLADTVEVDEDTLKKLGEQDLVDLAAQLGILRNNQNTGKLLDYLINQKLRT
jgi:hypothetical protein